MTYREAIRTALRESLTGDPRVFLMGEDVGRYGGAFAVSRGLLEEFGPERIRDTPLSESTFVGAGIGAALGGMRPIVELMTVNFSLLALDQIVNNAATLRHMSGGQLSVSLVVRMATGGGRQLAAQHSHSLEVWFAHVPGIKVLVLDGIEAEVVDLRSLRPLDTRTVLASVAKTHRAVIVDEGWRTCSLAAEISATIMEGGFYDLDQPVARVCSAEVPIPYAKHMEDAALPRVATIVETVLSLTKRRG